MGFRYVAMIFPKSSLRHCDNATMSQCFFQNQHCDNATLRQFFLKTRLRHCGIATQCRNVAMPTYESNTWRKQISIREKISRQKEQEKQKIRGGEIGVIFQDPLSSLNPVRRIGPQITEIIELHLGLSASAAQKRTIDMLNLVGIPNPKSRMKQYPHELSGGMRQRVCIAMSIAGEPKLLIADEPTTALDVTVQAQIVSLLKDIQKRLNMSIVLITHDIGIVSGMADYVAVMYAGRLIEFGPVEKVLLESMHPYTWGLLDSVSTLSTPIGMPFQGIKGNPPNLTLNIEGCPFVPRCDYSIADCNEGRPLLTNCDDREIGHSTACPVANNKTLRYSAVSKSQLKSSK